VYEGRTQTCGREGHAESRLKRNDDWEGAARNASLEAVLGKTRRTEFQRGERRRSHGERYTGTKPETADTDKREPHGPPRLSPTRLAVRPGNREGKLRSVDSERTGRVIEPRNLSIVEADVFGIAEGSTGAPRGGETATKQRNEAPAPGESRRQQRLPLSFGRPHGSGRAGSTGV